MPITAPRIFCGMFLNNCYRLSLGIYAAFIARNRNSETPETNFGLRPVRLPLFHYLFVFRIMYYRQDLSVQEPKQTVIIYHQLNDDRIVIFLPTALAKEVMQSPPSIRRSVRPSVGIFSTFWTDGPLTLVFCIWVWVGHDHGSQGIEGQDHRSISRAWVKLMRSIRRWSWAVCFLV